jgi:hypothetical protein
VPSTPSLSETDYAARLVCTFAASPCKVFPFHDLRERDAARSAMQRGPIRAARQLDPTQSNDTVGSERRRSLRVRIVELNRLAVVRRREA